MCTAMVSHSAALMLHFVALTTVLHVAGVLSAAYTATLSHSNTATFDTRAPLTDP